MLQTKVTVSRIKLPTKNSVDAYVYLPQEWSSRGFKECRYWNIMMYWNTKVGSLWGWTLQKILIISKNASNKSHPELNILHKTLWTQMSIYPGNGTRRLKRLPFLKYYNVLEGKGRFTLALKAAENALNKSYPE